jgi:hypothetical protein
MRKSSFLASLTVAAAAFGGAAHAASVTLCGPTICYEYDDAQAAAAAFGQPTLIGDSLRFLPASFLAASANGAGFDWESATFLVSRIYSTTGQDIISVSVFETGDYEIVGGGAVSADLYLLAASNLVGSDFAVATAAFDSSGASGGLQEWAIEAEILPTAVFGGPSSDLSLQIQNFLTAVTGSNGELAWIQKKLVLEVAVIPVPAAVWLFASALGLLAFARRRMS